MNNNVSPLEIINDDLISENVLNKISPGKWEALIEVLDFLTKDSDDIVVIQDSIILHSLKTGGILRANLLELFDNQKINLHISSPKKWVRLFKMLKSDDVYIIEESNRFIVTNGQIKLFLPKQLQSITEQMEFPNLDMMNVVTDTTIQKETRDKINNLSKGSLYIEFLIQSDKIKSINIPNTALFILPEYINDENVKTLNSDNAEIVLRSSNFLPYNADIYNIIICKDTINDKFALLSTCSSQLLKIEIFELLNDATGINDLF